MAPVVPRRSVRDCYREPDQPASREARRRAAVKPRPACFPSSTLRGCAAQSGVKGYYPLREPWHLSCHGGLCAIVTGNPTNPRAARPVAERRYFRSQLARLPNTPAPYGRGAGSRAARGRRKAGCPWDNPVCLWQTELFKFYLKSSPSPSGHNRRRRLATGSRQPKRGFGTAVPKTTIEVADHCPCLSGRWLRGRIRRTRGSSRCRRR